MGYQKCPVCAGTGMAVTIYSSNGSCPTCKGFRIIDELTGLPPKATGGASSTKTNFSSGDFRDDNNIETQQEYYGK